MSEINETKPLLYVFLKDSMKVGGIETYIYRLSKYIVRCGGRVLIILNKKGVLDESYKELEESDQVEIKHGRLSTQDIKSIIKRYNIKKTNVISFEILRFMYTSLLLRELSKNCDISVLYFVPHFKGTSSYPEERYTGKQKDKIICRFKKIIHKMNSNDNIRYFSPYHLKEMTKRYVYTVHDVKKQYLPNRGEQILPFDEERCVELAERTRFNILSVSRLEFPHKGFVIGLIKVYGQLKKRYPQVALTIVGYGDGTVMVQEEINKLDSTAQNDIRLVGKVAPDNLIEYYNDANVCVSLAGCFSLGAKNGTLSLPVRHYTYACETYGFLPESKDFSLSIEPGQPIIDYLEKILNMDTATYVDCCRKCYESYNTNQGDIERETIWNLSDGGNKKIISISDFVFIFIERIREHLNVYYSIVLSKFHRA